MDWTPVIGRRRPVEQDALRILTVVHQLGERPNRRWFIDHESQLQHFDHLVRHPIDLAYVLIDQFRQRPELDPRRADVARRIRQLLDTPSLPRRQRSLLRPFEPGSWKRWDDVLAYLDCRALMRTQLLADRGLRYRLTGRGARWLQESVYPSHRGSGTYRERCELLRAVLPASLLQPATAATLGADSSAIGRRLDAYRDEEHVGPEDDLLGHIFQATFREAL